MKPLYDRYQMIKRLLCASPISTIVRHSHTHTLTHSHTHTLTHSHTHTLTHSHTHTLTHILLLDLCYYTGHLCHVTLSVSQEEEDGSDEDCVSSVTEVERPVLPPLRAARPPAGEEDSDRDSDPAFVSPIDEVRAVRQQAAVTTANLHEASRSGNRPTKQ